MSDILPQLLINTLITGSIYCLVASGMAMTQGVMRILNFSHGHMMMLGAYIFYYFRYVALCNIGLSIFLDILLIAIISYFANKIFIQSFLKYDNYLPLVTTLALANILEAIVSLIFGVDIQSLPLEDFSRSIEYKGIFITPLQILIIFTTVVTILILAAVIHLTSYGKKLKAVSENTFSAEGIGINSTRLKSQIFIISSIVAGLAGVLVSYETNLQITMGRIYTMKALAAMVLGGLGNLWGTLAGSFLIALVENLSSGLDLGSFSLPAGYKDAFSFSIVLIVLLLKPSGIFNLSSRKV